MIETKQGESYLVAFLEKHKNHYIVYSVDVFCMSEVHKIVEWARENLEGDALGRLHDKDGSGRINTKWYIENEIDAAAFKLRWE